MIYEHFQTTLEALALLPACRRLSLEFAGLEKDLDAVEAGDDVLVELVGGHVA